MKVKLLRVGPIGTNCYILEDDQTNLAAVIDPGDEPELIQEALEKEGVEVRHSSPRSIPLPTPPRPPPGPPATIDANRAGSTLFPLTGEVDDLKLYDGGCDPPGDHEIQVLHTPGHSRLRHPEGGGDVLFTGGHPVRRLLRPHRPAGGSYEQIMQSLKRLGELKGDFTSVRPRGHLHPGAGAEEQPPS